jgi:cysteine synthase A
MTQNTQIDLAVSGTLKALGCVIGNTLLLVIDLLYEGEPRTLYAKSEQFNMTGSIRDRSLKAVNRVCRTRLGVR